MCGIFGVVVGAKSNLIRSDFEKLLRSLFLNSESRGKEAAGAAFCTKDEISVIRKALPASELLKGKEYKNFKDKAINKHYESEEKGLSVIGHARLVTNGLQGIDINNQPVVKGGVVCVHNGIIVNESNLWADQPSLVKESEVDTEVLAAMLDQATAAGTPISTAAATLFSRIYGEASIGVLFSHSEKMLLATNTGSIYFVSYPVSEVSFFCSEEAIARKVIAQMGWSQCTINQLRANNATLINLANSAIEKPFALDSLSVNNSKDERIENRLILTNNDLIRQRWLSVHRCSRCILPSTMPFINFDADGVCNFCRNYEKQKIKGEENLLRILDKYRSKNGDADCLVGFSGGRDSSYGLHLLKTKYGMNPIAYTYDWGMVTDLARRNQARLCGKLGVEHIWVSADIKSKRKNVKENVEAWLKKPDLGMVPLFMAGDKQFMWHANRLMKETDIRLMVYSTNHYERTDFKTGFCGVAPTSAGVRLNKMPLFSKMKLISYYLKQYLSNPGYINSSFYDTFFAFLSYYFVKQDFLYIFDFINWDEEVINNILINEYEWELAKDTPTTWRIGDGTAPFYNYIYQTVAGFSEYETFRSNQIREGVMTREEAMKLVEKENLPRIDSIKEYCSVIGVDFDMAMRRINEIDKMY